MSKLDKSIKNAQVAFVFYFITLAISFVSRKIFIETLGTELVGLSSTMQSILGFLNLAELGIYSAVSYALYKPLVNKDHEEINKIISLFGYLYRWVGLVILVAGIILSFFLPLFFEKTELSSAILYASYFTFLTVTLFSYFNNYRQILLAADQRTYTVTRITNYLSIIKVILQIILLKYVTNNYFIWLMLELVFGLLTRYLTNRKVKKDYVWLQPNLKNGRQLLKEYPQIIKNTKNLFSHKIAEFVLRQTDQILIYIFTTLTTVTYYTNYTMITKRLSSLIISTLGSNLAGVGHVVAENNPQKTIKLFNELNSIFFFVAGVVICCLYYLTDPFVVLWLGKEFVLQKTIFILILSDLYIQFIRQSVIFFINGYGLYGDISMAWLEAGLNLLISVVAGYFWGLFGILLGTVISTFFIVGIWKPYFLFKNGFKISVYAYWKNVLKYILIFIIAFLPTTFIINYLPEINSYSTWVFNAFIIFTYILVGYGGLMYFFAPGMKDMFLRLKSGLSKKKKS